MLCFLIGTVSYAQTSDFSLWDRDQNDRVDRNEFDYSFKSKEFDEWDKNGDYTLDQSEWQHRSSIYFDEKDKDTKGRFESFDTDNNNLMDKNEYNSAVFDLWDNDKSGDINTDEYETFREKMAK